MKNENKGSSLYLMLALAVIVALSYGLFHTFKTTTSPLTEVYNRSLYRDDTNFPPDYHYQSGIGGGPPTTSPPCQKQ